MRDIHSYFHVPSAIRKLRDITLHLSRARKCIIAIGPASDIPNELQKDAYLINYDFPDAGIIETITRKMIGYVKEKDDTSIDIENKSAEFAYHKVDNGDGLIEKYKAKYSDSEVKRIVTAAQGLTAQEVQYAISKNIKNNQCGEIIPKMIAEEKKNIIKKSRVLEIWTKTEKMSNIGGLDTLKAWIGERCHAVTGNALNFGVRPPKGMLIVGVPGCGKSMICKAIANEWDVTLTKLDMGKIYAGYVGSSERNAREMIIQAESIGTSVLWIDEFEKGMSGTASSSHTDGGTTNRVYGTILTWMNEKTKPVFVAATANEVSQLDPAILRKGRFDVVWFVDLPTEEERRYIFKVHLSKFGRNLDRFDINSLAKITYKKNNKEYEYSGSEIEESINDSLFGAYNRNRNAKINGRGDITDELIAETMSSSIPLSCTSEEKIRRLREWGRKNARFASSIRERECTDKTITVGTGTINPMDFA
jgi:ATP-dependent 26S proteasome regulatory subunit